jgi:hypothetical protein
MTMMMMILIRDALAFSKGDVFGSSHDNDDVFHDEKASAKPLHDLSSTSPALGYERRLETHGSGWLLWPCCSS